MSTRRAVIIKWADDQSVAAIDAVPDSQATRKNTLRKVFAVCRELVDRKKPLYPSAAEVADAGLAGNLGFESFPAKQTLNNQYREMMGYWRQAYRDVQNLKADKPLEVQEFSDWDTSHLDAGSRYIIESYKKLLNEASMRNNALKRLITDNVTIDLDRAGPDYEDTLNNLAYWTENVEKDGFRLSEFGLAVTPRTQPGTIILDRELWEGLKRMVENYRSASISKDAFRD